MICRVDGFGLGGIGQQHRHIGAQAGFAQQFGKLGAARAGLAHHDATGVEVVVQGFAFAQELGAEHELRGAQRLPCAYRVAHRHGGLDDHDRLRVDGHDLAHHRFDGLGVEGVGVGVVVGGRGDEHEVGALVSVARVEGGTKVQWLVGQKRFDVGILNRGTPLVEQGHFVGHNVDRHHLVPLRQQHGVGQTHITQSSNSDFHAPHCLMCHLLNPPS